MRRRYGSRVAMGAAAAASLAVAGALVPVGAMADEAEEASFETLAIETMEEDGDVQAVGHDANGEVVVFTTDADAEIDGPLADEEVTTRTLDAPLVPYSEGNVVGGGGYLTGDDTPSGVCSIGFSGWDPDGNPAVITAGHCTDDGAFDQTIRTQPSSEPAGGGEAPLPLSPLGEFGFSQYGGPGNTPGEPGDTDAVDIAVIDVTNDDSDLLPEVTTWSSDAIAANDLSVDTTLVTSTGSAVAGEEASKSGRTTGFTTGEVGEIVEGWANIGGRYVYGFQTNIEAAEGDSGGAIIQGGTAIGIVSGGSTDDGENFTWGADLNASLELTGGYTVALHIAAPELTSPEDGGSVGAGGTISGTAAAGTTLVVTPADGEEFEVEVGDDGEWSFSAPDELGDFEFSIQSYRGFDESAQNDYLVEVLPAAPTFTSPEEDGRYVTELTEITGTGDIGATLELSGAVTAEAEVDAEGNWSIPADLGPGAYELSATQTVDGVESAEANIEFVVVPTAPEITSPGDGDSYGHDEAPTSATGTGVAGADIVASIDGTTLETTVDENGEWATDFSSALEADEYTLEVTQTVNGQTSDAQTIEFVVEEAPAPSPSPTEPDPGTDPGTDPGAGDDSGSLPETGVSDTAALAGAAGLALLAGVGLMLASRRRNAELLN
ncbi:MAG TPA: S1 family peptidase [Jiangellaceae bacterium]|nr:S1 family peptidase [Jiangellaceae bacterium]